MIGIDCGHLVEPHDAAAMAEQNPPLDDDVVRVVGVPLVADVLDLADVPSVEGDHVEALGVG